MCALLGSDLGPNANYVLGDNEGPKQTANALAVRSVLWRTLSHTLSLVSVVSVVSVVSLVTPLLPVLPKI